jgi:isopentenyl phosphate kinase
MNELVFLKLGGSLITDKTRPYTARLGKLGELAEELQSALSEMHNIRLILGHGSGSFGHHAVQEHLARETYRAMRDQPPQRDEGFWRGFAEVWYRAAELNRHVMSALHGAGLQAISLPPSAAVTAADGRIASWDLGPLHAAVAAGLLPVIFGDIVLDSVRGGSVLSTETLMTYLAQHLRPSRILLAGLEAGVWQDYPNRQTKIGRITPATYPSLATTVGGSHGADVTGGMKSKVEAMLALVEQVRTLTVQIFSGEQAGNIRLALRDPGTGTTIASD